MRSSLKGFCKRNSFQFKPITAAITAAIAASSVLVTFPASSFVLEEIVVTAQKREQSLMDVPASVSWIRRAACSLGSTAAVPATVAGSIPAATST